MDRYLNAQLAKLKTDCIDYYLLHALNGSVWDKLTGLDITDFLDSALADVVEEMEDDQLAERLTMAKKMFTIKAD